MENLWINKRTAGLSSGIANNQSAAISRRVICRGASSCRIPESLFSAFSWCSRSLALWVHSEAGEPVTYSALLASIRGSCLAQILSLSPNLWRTSHQKTRNRKLFTSRLTRCLRSVHCHGTSGLDVVTGHIGLNLRQRPIYFALRRQRS